MNRLANETSPYLRQHAHHPVDWYPWGEEAFAKAQALNKPILLSSGYSACHWCHVMARESFTNERIAAIMNEHFINIKVDKEERPDVDQVYQQACQLFTGQGGWPLTGFLTPQGEPFFVGTYFPPKARYGLVGFEELLLEMARIYREGPETIRHTVKIIKHTLTGQRSSGYGGSLATEQEIRASAERLLPLYDGEYGGFGPAPKFPMVNLWELFLSLGSPFAPLALKTLRIMAQGGIQDQIGGGFHRYSTDRRWLVPHFEKMLYDNALLCLAYSHAYQFSKDNFFREIACKTARWLLREMQHPEGGFYAALDADTEGEEGKYYLWHYDTIQELFSSDDADLLCQYYGITPQGNFAQGQNILHRSLEPEELAERIGLAPTVLKERLSALKQQMLAHREKRVRPFRDEKIITAWNGLAIAGLALAGRIFDRPAYIEAAHTAWAFIRRHLWIEGRLYRSYLDRRSRTPGFLEDYAYLVFGLVELYQATFREEYLEDACTLTQTSLDLFWDEATGNLYSTTEEKHLFHRPTTPWDESMPSPVGITTLNLLRLGSIERKFLEQAEILLATHKPAMLQEPFGHATLLYASLLAQRGIKEVRLVGERTDPELAKMLKGLKEHYAPHLMVFLYEGDSKLPRFQGLEISDRATAYVCHRFTCSPPLQDPASLLEMVGTLQ